MIWLSLGETCLPDRILKRHSLKTFSTIFSNGRGNIDYALDLENQKYSGLLDSSNLEYCDAWGKKVVRSTKYKKCEDLFDNSVNKGFEFTHHDVIGCLDDLNSYERKISRLNEIRKNKDICFLYYHRPNQQSCVNTLVGKLNNFAEYYVSDISECKVILMLQSVVNRSMSRRLEPLNKVDCVMPFVFHTEQVWKGNDPNVFWANIDDDLISAMFKYVDERTAIPFLAR